jgi:outer membrane protein assembly factor BamB
MGDWPQWGGSGSRNNAPVSGPIPATFDVETGENICWSTPLGSETYGNPVVSGGKIYIGTNNGSGFVERYPPDVDLGVLLCIEEKTGQRLWQHSNEKLDSGRAHDWPNVGICSSPLIEGNRLWYVTNRGEVVCLDTDGFHDDENDGPFVDESDRSKDEADVVWRFDMMGTLGVSQHNMCSCSVTGAGSKLFVLTGNGIDVDHKRIPAPSSPSFLCLDKQSGEVLWSDSTPGPNIMHGQWSSPAFGLLGGVEQVLFGGGDGWLYSFDPQGDAGKSKLLWKFDTNAKSSVYDLRNTTRLHIIGTPVIYRGLVYIGTGEDPEHGEGPGILWAIDPSKRGDVSPSLVQNRNSPSQPVPLRRIQALLEANDEIEIPNPNSAVVWKYSGNPNSSEGLMHRTCSTVAVQKGLLIAVDSNGVVHCVDAKNGTPYWTFGLEAPCWGSPLIADEKIYVGSEEGDVTVLELSSKLQRLGQSSVGSSLYSTPIVANDILYIASRKRLFAIGLPDKPSIP